jgi:hypothetical protein
MIIPPLDARSLKQPPNQPFGDHPKYSSLSRTDENHYSRWQTEAYRAMVEAM